MSRADKLFGADNKIEALDNQLVIFLMSNLSWSCRLAHKVVWGRHERFVEVDFRRNKARLVENAQVMSIDELDYGTSSKCRSASV